MSLPKASVDATEVQARYDVFMRQPEIRRFCQTGGRVYVATEQFTDAIALALWQAGHQHFSLKYLHEVRLRKQVCPEMPVSFYGRLQSRKIGSIAAYCGQIESVARQKEAEKLLQLGYQGPLFIQVNISHEPQKNGVLLADAAQHLDALLRLPLQWVGLMAIPATSMPSAPAFARLRLLADRLGLPRCMMGMSADYSVAIAEGATDIRIRRVLLGDQPHHSL